VKAALYATEAALALTAAGTLAVGSGELAEWLAANPLHPLAFALPAGVVLRLARGRRPLDAVIRWHGAAVRRLDG
jgi:hypothetical protein